MLRVAAITTVVVALSVSAHLVGGGHSTPVLAVLLAGCLTGSIVLASAGRRLSGLRIGGLLALGQVVFHGLFVAFGSPASCLAGAAGGAGAHGGGHGHATGALASCGASIHPETMSAHHAQLSTGMIAAHAGATVVATLILVHGERVLWALRAWLTAAVVRPAVAALPVPPEQPRPARFFVPHPLAFVPRGEYRRGPPPSLVSIA